MRLVCVLVECHVSSINKHKQQDNADGEHANHYHRLHVHAAPREGVLGDGLQDRARAWLSLARARARVHFVYVGGNSKGHHAKGRFKIFKKNPGGNSMGSIVVYKT